MKFHLALVFLTGLSIAETQSRDLRAEMERAEKSGREASSLLTHNEIRPFWADDGSKLVYRVNTGRNEHRFFQVDLQSGAKTPAFDHEALAKALAAAASKQLSADRLPIDEVAPSKNSGVVRFRAFGKGWSFDAAKTVVTPEDVPAKPANLMAPEDVMRARGGSGGPTQLTIENGTAGDIELFWVEGRGRLKSYGKLKPSEKATQLTYSGHAWVMKDAAGNPLAGVVAKDTPSIARVEGRIEPVRHKRDDQSPDGQWRASIRNDNLVIEPTGGGPAVNLSTDGTRENRYTGPIDWSPDSKKITAFRVKQVETRQIHIVQSSPPDQLQPKLLTVDYPKPGDAIAQPKPHLFDVVKRTQIPVSDALFGNPWDIGSSAWNADSTEFSFLYNQRGHQLLRMVGIRADSGAARTIFEETSTTFIDYSQKTWLYRLPSTGEILWMSERDGHNHLYRIDAATGQIRKQITRGDWNVREVLRVDEEKRELLLKILGVPGQDPYQIHFVRIGFDGEGFTRLTQSDGNHGIEFSTDGKWILDTWSRVDQPPVVEVRGAADGKLLAEIERADDSALQKTGWSRPERFVAKGRDGKTDIYGIITRPTRFDPAKKYPVVEDIYAGPHDFFVPKNYMTWSGMNAVAELGFIVVKIDGMGTNWRSKAFHDTCWKNLMDAGFPDRIPWIQAAATTRPWMDLTRVGIFGGSAGGQNTLAGLLHHGDFYKVGVADCGCHDNRMDKIWWNEAWMGWPVDESYARNSNVVNAAKLTGKLLLVVGEVDTNVDPASTAQVVAALEKAGKDFDFLPIMGSNHGAAESPYGKYRRADFLVRHLQATE